MYGMHGYITIVVIVQLVMIWLYKTFVSFLTKINHNIIIYTVILCSSTVEYQTLKAVGIMKHSQVKQWVLLYIRVMQCGCMLWIIDGCQEGTSHHGSPAYSSVLSVSVFVCCVIGFMSPIAVVMYHCYCCHVQVLFVILAVVTCYVYVTPSSTVVMCLSYLIYDVTTSSNSRYS